MILLRNIEEFSAISSNSLRKGMLVSAIISSKYVLCIGH